MGVKMKKIALALVVAILFMLGGLAAGAYALFCKAILLRGYDKDIAYPMWLSVRLAGWPHYQKLSVYHKFPLDVIFPEALA